MVAVASRALRRLRGRAGDDSCGEDALGGEVPAGSAVASPGKPIGLPNGLPALMRSGAVVMLVSKVSPAGLGRVRPAG